MFKRPVKHLKLQNTWPLFWYSTQHVTILPEIFGMFSQIQRIAEHKNENVLKG